MERSRKTNARITKSRIDLPEYFNSPFAISMYPHIDEFTERGQIVIGHVDPVGPVAIAAEGRNTIAAPRRGKDETFKQLLARLDMVHPPLALPHQIVEAGKGNYLMSDHNHSPKSHEPHAIHHDTKGPHDAKEINPKMASDIAYWSKELGVTGDQLHELIRIHGVHIDKLRAALNSQKSL